MNISSTNVNEELLKAQEAFQDNVHALLNRFRNQQQIPQAIADKVLMAQFKAAYPTPEVYFEAVFKNSLQLAENYSLPHPPLPNASIFDTQTEPIAGIGHSFFMRLVYLDNLATRAISKLEGEQLNRQHSNTRKLPQLKLVLAKDIYQALYYEGHKDLSQSLVENKPKVGMLKGLLQTAYDLVTRSNVSIGIGYVTDASEHMGKKFVSVLFRNKGASQSPLKVLLPANDQKPEIGSLIAATQLTSARPLQPDYYTVSKIDVLVPAQIVRLLKNTDPQFYKRDNPDYEMFEEFRESDDPSQPGEYVIKFGSTPLTNDHQGEIVAGRIARIDKDSSYIQIYDLAGKLQLVKLAEKGGEFNLKKGDFIIARAVQLDNEGIYTIRKKETVKLSPEHRDRIENHLSVKATDFTKRTPKEHADGFASTKIDGGINSPECQ